MSNLVYRSEHEVVSAALRIMESKLSVGEDARPLSVSATSQFFRIRLGREEREIFSVMFLNAQNQMIATEDLFFGSVNSASVYPREVVKSALKHNASNVILAHNHPSNNVTPSESDKRLTIRLKEALGLVDVVVLDHIIVSSNKTFSFVENHIL